MSSIYSLGRQPCADFKAMPSDNPYGEWINDHECFGPYDQGDFALAGCEGRISFCTNCGADHHSNGFETCGRGDE